MTAHPASASEVLAEIARFTDQLRVLPAARSEKDAIDRIQALETLTSAADALKARETLTLDMLRRNSEACDGVPASRQGKGLGAEIGLARRVSRSRGSRLLAFARTLLLDLPHTYEALKTGIISEEKAQTVANETSWLSREKRQQVDEDMVGRLGDLGVRQLGHTVRALAQQADQTAAVETPPLLPRLSSDPPGATVRPVPSPPGPEEEPGADFWGGDLPAYEHEHPGEVIIIDEELGEDDAWPIPGRHVPRRSPEYESAVRAFRERDDFEPMREWMNGVEGQASAREARSALSLLSDPAVLARRKSQADLFLAAKLSAWRAEHPVRPGREHPVRPERDGKGDKTLE